MVVRRRPLLLLLCLAALSGSVDGKRCRDKKTSSGKSCEKKRAKSLCVDPASGSCPKPKKDGKKCKKARKKCRLTCGLCVSGVSSLTNTPVNPNYVPDTSALTKMLTTCKCTPLSGPPSKGPLQTTMQDDYVGNVNMATNPVYGMVGGWDTTTGAAPSYFCVKTEYKGVDGELAYKTCHAPPGGAAAASNAMSCQGGMVVCGPSGYPSPPPPPLPPPPPPPSPPPTPPPFPPPPSPPPPPTPPPSSCIFPKLWDTVTVPPLPYTVINTRAKLILALNWWCSDSIGVVGDGGVGDAGTGLANILNNAKNPQLKCAPSTWKVSGIKDFSALFDSNTGVPGSTCDIANWGKVDPLVDSRVSGVAGFDGSYDDINAWDVSAAESMANMFEGATHFNFNLSSWDVSKVTDMRNMFKKAKAFDQPAVSGWLKGTHAIAGEKLTGMFEGASAFNQELNSWNVAKVTKLDSMFKGATNFSKEIGSWNVAKVISTKEMFSAAHADFNVAEGLRSYFDQNLNDWDVGNVADMSFMFSSAVTFNAPLSSWNVAKLSKAESMFDTATRFNQNLTRWDTGTNTGTNAAGVQVPNYGLVNAGTANWKNMFKATAMSVCNKQEFNKKMQTMPQSSAVFSGAGGANGVGGGDWSYPHANCYTEGEMTVP